MHFLLHHSAGPGTFKYIDGCIRENLGQTFGKLTLLVLLESIQKSFIFWANQYKRFLALQLLFFGFLKILAVECGPFELLVVNAKC